MAGKKTKKRLSADELAEKFDRGEDISDSVDFEKAVQRVNVDFPTWVVKELDSFSDKVGITRTALIKTWIHDRLVDEKSKKIAASD